MKTLLDGRLDPHSRQFGAVLAQKCVVRSLKLLASRPVVLNKQDSSYGMFGSVEVYVPTEDLERAQSALSASEDGGTPT